MKSMLLEPANIAIHRIATKTGYAKYISEHYADAKKIETLEIIDKDEPNALRLIARLGELKN